MMAQKMAQLNDRAYEGPSHHLSVGYGMQVSIAGAFLAFSELWTQTSLCA